MKKIVQDIISSLPEDRKESFKKLHETIVENLPQGFEVALSYGMLSYVVPLKLYPAGYHCKAAEPLPFISIASQKTAISLYHMGIYASPELLKWFVEEFPKYSDQKLDMGKSCIRFKKPEKIPFELIGKLATKMGVEDWIKLYEQQFRRKS